MTKGGSHPLAAERPLPRRSTKRVQVYFDDHPSMTKQSFKDSCDIHTILRKYRDTGLPPPVPLKQLQYGDFSNVPSYQEALLQVQSAQESFSELPSHVRERFGNDPGRFLQFVHDAHREPEKASELVKMGLATEKETKSTKKDPEEKETKSTKKDPEVVPK